MIRWRVADLDGAESLHLRPQSRSVTAPSILREPAQSPVSISDPKPFRSTSSPQVHCRGRSGKGIAKRAIKTEEVVNKDHMLQPDKTQEAGTNYSHHRKNIYKTDREHGRGM